MSTVDEVLAARPVMSPVTPSGQRLADTMKTWFINADDEFDEDAWQHWVGEITMAEREAASASEKPYVPDPHQRIPHRCPEDCPPFV